MQKQTTSKKETEYERTNQSNKKHKKHKNNIKQTKQKRMTHKQQQTTLNNKKVEQQ